MPRESFSSATAPSMSVAPLKAHPATTAAAAAAEENAAPLPAIAPVKTPQPNSRLLQLPAYVFAHLNQLKAEVAPTFERPLIDLGMGNPDRPTPAPIVEQLTKAVQDPENHGYPTFKGKDSFLEAVASWMQRRYGVSVDPQTQVQTVIGTKEGIFHLLQGYLEPGDTAIMSELHYPAYERGSLLTGAEQYLCPANESNDFLPDLDAIPEAVWQRAKILMLNYPNNPTGATAPRSYLEKAVAYCRKYCVVLLSDLAYGEITYDGHIADSVLSIPGAMDVAIEFHSFSKTFHMAGWRIGYAVGNAEIIKTLYTMKSNIDYGACRATQDAATFALNHAEDYIPEVVSEYDARRHLLAEGFARLGWAKRLPKGAFYYWLPTPRLANGQSEDSLQFVERVMRQAGVVLTPGIAFGKAGQYYFRVSLVSPQEKLREAIEALEAAGIRYS